MDATFNDKFFKNVVAGYIDALFFVAGSEEGDDFYGYGDVSISAELERELEEACKDFVVRNIHDMVGFLERYDASQLGHVLFLSSYGAGAGFFDHESDDLFERLERSAYSSFTLTKYIEVGDYNTLVLHPHYFIDK